MSAVCVYAVNLSTTKFNHAGYFYLRVFSADEHGVRRPSIRIDRVGSFSENQVAIGVYDIGHFSISFLPAINYRAVQDTVFDVDGGFVLSVARGFKPDVRILFVTLVHAFDNVVAGCIRLGASACTRVQVAPSGTHDITVHAGE